MLSTIADQELKIEFRETSIKTAMEDSCTENTTKKGDTDEAKNKKDKITRYLCACSERRFFPNPGCGLGFGLGDFPPDEIECTLPVGAFLMLEGPERGKIHESILSFLKQVYHPTGIINKVVLNEMPLFPHSGMYGEPGPRSSKVIYINIPYEKFLEALKVTHGAWGHFPQTITLHIYL